MRSTSTLHVRSRRRRDFKSVRSTHSKLCRPSGTFAEDAAHACATIGVSVIRPTRSQPTSGLHRTITWKDTWAQERRSVTRMFRGPPYCPPSRRGEGPRMWSHRFALQQASSSIFARWNGAPIGSCPSPSARLGMTRAQKLATRDRMRASTFFLFAQNFRKWYARPGVTAVTARLGMDERPRVTSSRRLCFECGSIRRGKRFQRAKASRTAKDRLVLRDECFATPSGLYSKSS